MQEKFILPFLVLVSVLLRSCGVEAWVCDLYLLNVAVLLSDTHCQHSCRCGTGRVPPSPRTQARGEQTPQRIRLDLSPSGEVVVSWHSDRLASDRLKAYKCDGGYVERELSSGRQWSDKYEGLNSKNSQLSQEPKQFPKTEDTPQEMEDMGSEGHATPPPTVSDKGRQLPRTLQYSQEPKLLPATEDTPKEMEGMGLEGHATPPATVSDKGRHLTRSLQISQEPKDFPTTDIPLDMNMKDLQGHTAPQLPTEDNGKGRQLPQQRVARARAQAALRDRYRAREFAGKKT